MLAAPLHHPSDGGDTAASETVDPPALFQAVKSYLHFSQLSAWLNQTRGSAPKSVEYRYFTLPNPSGTDILGSQVRRVQVLYVYAATLHIHVHY